MVLLVLIVVGGLLGRRLLGDRGAGGFLADWLPWLAGTDVTLYFGDPSGDYLVPISRTLSGDDDTIEGLAQALLTGPAAETGLIRLIPPEASVGSIGLAGSTVHVDIVGTALDDALAWESLVHSLGSWPGVDEVRATVGGTSVRGAAAQRLLFYYDPGRDMLVATPSAAETARDLLQEYLIGPGEARLVGLPGDVEVLEYESSPGSNLIRLNLRYTDALRQMAVDDGDGMRRILEGLIATLTSGPTNIDFVYLDFEGHATLGLGQCANLLRTVQPVPDILNDERLVRADGV